MALLRVRRNNILEEELGWGRGEESIRERAVSIKYLPMRAAPSCISHEDRGMLVFLKKLQRVLLKGITDFLRTLAKDLEFDSRVKCCFGIFR